MISLKKTILIGFSLSSLSFNLHSSKNSFKEKEKYPMKNVTKKIQEEEKFSSHQKKISLNDGSKPGGNKIFSREYFFPNPQSLQAPAFFAYRQKAWNPSTKIDSMFFNKYQETSMKNSSSPVKKNSPEKKKISHRVKEDKSFFAKCCPFVSGSGKKNQKITAENKEVDNQEDEFFSAKESHSSHHSSQESLLNQQVFPVIPLFESDKFSVNSDDFVPKLFCEKENFISFDDKKFNDAQEENQLMQEENQCLQEKENQSMQQENQSLPKENQSLPKENHESYDNFFDETHLQKEEIFQTNLEEYDGKVLYKPEETKDIQDQEEEGEYDIIDLHKTCLEIHENQRKRLEDKAESVSQTSKSITDSIIQDYQLHIKQ